MRRLLAALAAVALVGGAVLIRQRIDDDATTGAGGDDTVRLVCGTDVVAACQELADRNDSIRVTFEDEAVTTDRLSTLTVSPRFDAWVAAAPWPAIVADNRNRSGVGGKVLGASSKVLARSPATIVALKDRAQALTGACNGAVTWACIGGFAGSPWTDAGGSTAWGDVKPGLAPPDGGAGLVTLSQAVASKVGHPDWASNDVEDPAVSAWFDQLVGAAKQAEVTGQTPLARFLVVPASYGAVGALEAESGPSVSKAADRSNLSVIYPEPVATADVTVTPAAGGDAADVLDRIDRNALLDALAATGWRVPGHRPAAGVRSVPALPTGSGLPSPGALQYLRDRWQQVP